GVEAEEVADREAVGEVGGLDLGRAHPVALVAVDARAAEEAELVLREAVEVAAGEVVDLGREALELRQVPGLRERRVVAQEVLLVGIEVRVAGEAPGIPGRAPVVAARKVEPIARA